MRRWMEDHGNWIVCRAFLEGNQDVPTMTIYRTITYYQN